MGAQKGLLGLEVAREQLPDLIICDICMPELNGYQVLRKLREDPITAKIPFIFLSGEPREQNYRYAIKSGANDYVPKFSLTGQLLQAIQAQLKPLQLAPL